MKIEDFKVGVVFIKQYPVQSGEATLEVIRQENNEEVLVKVLKDTSLDLAWDIGREVFVSIVGAEDQIEIIKPIKQNTIMKITNLVKKILDKDMRKLVEAGFINGDLALTEEGTAELLGILFLEKKAELVKIAEEIITEKKK